MLSVLSLSSTRLCVFDVRLAVPRSMWNADADAKPTVESVASVYHCLPFSEDQKFCRHRRTSTQTETDEIRARTSEMVYGMCMLYLWFADSRTEQRAR